MEITKYAEDYNSNDLKGKSTRKNSRLQDSSIAIKLYFYLKKH